MSRMEILSERFKSLLASPRLSDMTFYVERDDVSIPAHRLIVFTASNVMANMVYSAGAMTVDAPHPIVPVRDCSYADFYQVPLGKRI